MWRSGVPTIAQMGGPLTREEIDDVNMSKFADAEEDALPLDRPHAPNYVDLRKFLRKGSSAERYADANSSSDKESWLKKMPLRDIDDKKTRIRNGELPKSLKCYGSPGICLQHHGDDVCNCALDSSSTATVPFPYPKAQRNRGTGDEDGRGEEYILVQRNEDGSRIPKASLRNCGTFKTFTVLDSRPIRHARNNERSLVKKFEGTGARGISFGNVLARMYHFIGLALAKLYQFLKSTLSFPFRVWHAHTIQSTEVQKTPKDFSLTETMVSVSSDRKPLYTTKIVEKGKDIDWEESESSSEAKTLGFEATAEPDLNLGRKGHLKRRTSLSTARDDAHELEWIGSNEPRTRDGVEEILHRSNEKVEEFSPSKFLMTAPGTSIVRSTEDEDGGMWLWRTIENSEKWTEGPGGDLHPSMPVKDLASPMGFKPPTQRQSRKHCSGVDYSNENCFNPTEQRPVEMDEIGRATQVFVAEAAGENEPLSPVDSAILSAEERRILRKISDKLSPHPTLERQRSSEPTTRTIVDSSDTILTDSANYDTHFSPEKDGSSSCELPQQVDRDLVLSTPSQPPTPGSTESRKKTPIRAGIKNDVKAVTESVKRVLFRNKPEPDTRFTSPRSAQKTLTIVADVMRKEFDCFVAMRRSGAQKLRSEKIYSSDARLRISLRFQPLDAFSCNVIIFRSRDDDFSVSTADYVTFIAGLQQTFLNSVTGAWRYQ
ncbi:unnamed protein product [Agarophyton chilense]